MAVLDFLIWHCAGCGAAAKGTTKPCGCVTNVGTRKGPNGFHEFTWWNAPLDPRDALIADQSAALALAEGALGGALVVVESIPRPDGLSRELHAALDRRIEAIHKALAAIAKLKATGEKEKSNVET